MAELVIIKKFFYRHQAEQAKGLLEEKDIEAIVSADDCGGFRPDLTLGMGNVRLLVQEQDAQKAFEVLQVLDQDISEVEVDEETRSIFQPSTTDLGKHKVAGFPLKFILALVGFFLLIAIFYSNVISMKK